MNGKISVVINTFNEEKHIERAIRSVSWADEVLVCDMNSDDDTALIAKKLGAKVIFHKRMGYVEPARNFAITKAAHEWILILDADEEISESLGKRLQEMIQKPIVSTYVEIPRKNIIFNKWVKASMWWPDYNIRFFKIGSVTWSDKIHSKPKTEGQGIRLSEEERWAIIHHNYSTISQFLERMNRYTTIQAKELIKTGYKFEWKDLITKPTSEFLSRYFANRGFDDGLHGLALGLLQAFSFFVMYLKTWEKEEFKEQNLKLNDVEAVSIQTGQELTYWFNFSSLSKNPLKRIIQKAKNKIK